MGSSDHEEADTRIFNLINHSVQHGYKTFFVRTVDTDLVTGAVSDFHILKDRGLAELWLGIGKGKSYLS